MAACATLNAAEVLRTSRAVAYDDRAPFGRFTLEVEVEGEADLLVSGTRVLTEVYRGAEPRCGACVYSQPLPRAEFRTFTMKKKAGRGKVRLMEQPGLANNYTARVRIEDKDDGAGKYKVVLDWEVEPRGTIEVRRTGTYALPGRMLARPAVAAKYDNELKGSLHIEGRADGQARLYVRGDRVTVEGPFDVASYRFSQPLAGKGLRKFKSSKEAGEGKLRVLDTPSVDNGWTAVVDIIGDGPWKIEMKWER